MADWLVNISLPKAAETNARPLERLMDVATWILVTLAYVVGLIWSLIWFLISGWVSTLLQIAVLIAVIYWMRYRWQRAHRNPSFQYRVHRALWSSLVSRVVHS